MPRNHQNPLRWLWLSGFILMLDLATKFMAQQILEPFRPYGVLPFFNLTLVFNRGAAFSFLSDASGWQRWFFIGLGMIAVVVIIVWLRRLAAGDNWTALALALVLGGAVGNLMDRVWRGQVTDFLDFYYRDWHWPTFNLADTAISIGVAIVIIDHLWRSRQRS